MLIVLSIRKRIAGAIATLLGELLLLVAGRRRSTTALIHQRLALNGRARHTARDGRAGPLGSGSGLGLGLLSDARGLGGALDAAVLAALAAAEEADGDDGDGDGGGEDDGDDGAGHAQVRVLVHARRVALAVRLADEAVAALGCHHVRLETGQALAG